MVVPVHVPVNLDKIRGKISSRSRGAPLHCTLLPAMLDSNRQDNPLTFYKQTLLSFHLANCLARTGSKAL